MSYLSVIIKGDPFTAAREAAIREIPAVFVREVLGRNRTTVLRVSEVFYAPVAAWFGEPGAIIAGEGYAAGTCLLFTTHEDEAA